MAGQHYYQHIQGVRGIAIICIVCAHAWSFSIFWTGGLDSDGITSLFYLSETLFHGSTLYFAVLSGLLFSLVLQQKGYQHFFTQKFLNVVLPYITVSILLTVVYRLAFSEGEEFSRGLLLTVFNNLYMGAADIHLWYIPVLLALFVLTPLFAYLIQRATWLMYLVALLPLVISRSPFPDFIKPQSFVFFGGAYVLGMLLADHYCNVLDWVRRQTRILLLTVLAVSVTLYLQYQWQFTADSWFSSRQSLFYVQKVLVCLLVLSFLQQREHCIPAFMTILGRYSFAIYFLHVAFITVVIMSLRPVLESTRDAWLLAGTGVLNIVVGISFSVGIAMLMQRIFRKHSRKLIGA